MNRNEKTPAATEVLKESVTGESNVIIMPQVHAKVKDAAADSYLLTEKGLRKFALWLWRKGFYPMPARDAVPAFSAKKVGHYYDKNHDWFNPANPDGIWYKCQPGWNMVSLWLRNNVLVDDDSAKDNGKDFDPYRHLVAEETLVQERAPKDENDKFPSKHYWYALPDGAKVRNRNAPEESDQYKTMYSGRGFDVKTGNQLIYFKPGKYVKTDALLNPQIIPQEFLSLLALDASDKKTYSLNKEQRAKARASDYAFGNLDGVALDSWAKPEWLRPQSDMRENGGDATAGRWQIVTEMVKAGLTFEHYMALPCAQERADERGIDWLYTYDWLNACEEIEKRQAEAVPHNLEIARPEINANIIEAAIKELNIGHVNVLSPPGFAGEVVEALRERCYRNLDEIYSASAIAMMAAAARSVKPMPGVNSHSLVVMATAPTGGGKGICQSFFNQACRAALGRNPAGAVTSSKQPIEEMVDNDGVAIFNVDEAHAMFDKMSDKRSTHMQDLESIFLQFATASSYNFGPLHKREFLARIDKELGQTTIDAQTRAMLEQRREDILLGFPGKIRLVMLNISTPEKFNKVVSDDFIKSGFIGRAIVVCGPTEIRPDRTDLFSDNKATMPESLNEKFMALGMKTHQVNIDEATKEVLHNFKRLCNRDEYLNHPKIGCLFARAVERAMTLSSIAGSYSGLVTTEIAEWAIRMVLHHIDTCAGLLAMNELNEASSQEEKAEAGGEALMGWLRDILKGKQDIVHSVLMKKLHKNKSLRELVAQNPGTLEKALNYLEGDGTITIKTGERGAAKYTWNK